MMSKNSRPLWRRNWPMRGGTSLGWSRCWKRAVLPHSCPAWRNWRQTLPSLIDPNDTTGKEDIAWEETVEPEWGRRLDAAIAARENNALVVASPTVPSWNQILTFLHQIAKFKEIGGSAA